MRSVVHGVILGFKSVASISVSLHGPLRGPFLVKNGELHEVLL